MNMIDSCDLQLIKLSIFFLDENVSAQQILFTFDVSSNVNNFA
jgi:hypothetical protein